MNRLFLIAFIIIVSSSIAFGETIVEGPFAGIDLSSLPKETSQIIEQANEDYILVLKGFKPRHAIFDKNAPLPSDGGTTFYKGNKYTLTIVKSISSFGGLNGYIYGPIIWFDKGFAPGNSNSVKDLRFYTFQQLNELLKR